MTKRKKGYSKKFRKQTIPRKRDKEGILLGPSNTIRFTGLTKELKDPYNIPYSLLYYYVTKHRSKAGQQNPYLAPGKIYLPEPQAIIVIVELYKGKHPLSFPTPTDYVINVPSIRKFTAEILTDIKAAMAKQIAGNVKGWGKSDDPDDMETDRIKAYSIKFIY